MDSKLPSPNSRSIEASTVDSKTADILLTRPQRIQVDIPPIAHVTPHTIPGNVTKTGPITIGDLPNELLLNILSHFDTEAPSSSDTRLHDQPTLNVTNSTQDLKNISIVSKRWRSAVLPLLFKSTRYILKYSEEDTRPILNDLIGPFLQFLYTSFLADIVSSFTLVVKEKNISNCLDGRPRIYEFDSFWQRLFRTIDPSIILIAAPVEALGSLTSAAIDRGDLWIFETECHYLRLERPVSKEPKTIEKKNVPKPKHPQSNGQPNLPDDPNDTPYIATSSEIFQIRPWTSLLLNEGSHLEAYKVTDWEELSTPSILPNLLGNAAMNALINPGIRSMKYIAIFPGRSHFQYLSTNMPRLDHLYCQLVPRNNILENPEITRRIDVMDLWIERNNCYALLLREMFDENHVGNYRYLKTFESGDAADTEAWEAAVEFVKHSGGGWKAVGNGVFARDDVDADSSE